MNTKEEILENGATSSEKAILFFDELPAVSIDFMLGRWKGEELFTEHPMDGQLKSTGWYGKVFEDAESVGPLLFYTDRDHKETFMVNPISIMNENQEQYRKEGVFLGDFREQLETKEFKARLRMLEHRGVISATMIYDEAPINDIFRKIDENTVLGVMDLKYVPQPYFFLLRRD
ncbi:hypothetical protein CEY12_17905 [Chryseobacterium sp. T16E-39]|uniref:DUF4334 domain-containing protein n=1 Tax=Chryseobacterium sp. T16E-39 TaxID=2015076 RepID=UPI000B5B15D5|nr:DUF4334 domain-containing protein [Chryseobacterium sp. T16E-39]ASK31865.1 hypothetical protein CEY12_17905 [Chryseobacterium sp. T16E-39]